jgi:predicted alpha/beta-fold hydrolase
VLIHPLLKTATTFFRRLNGTHFGRFVYSQGMGGNLLKLLQKHSAELSKYPDHIIAPALARGLSLKTPTMEDFDQAFTRVGGGSSPPFPFDSSDDYYAWASSHKVLPDIKVPFLAVNAADDPIVQEVPVDAGGTGWVTMVLTPKGGHLGWFERALPSGEVPRWITKPVLEWLKLNGEDIVYEGTKGRPLYEEDGFIKEVGRPGLGCKEIEGGGIITGAAEGGLLQGL